MKRSNVQRTRRALSLGLSLLGPALAQAAPVAELRGYIVGGAAFSPGFYYSQSVSPATMFTPVLTHTESDAGIDGSYAHGKVEVGFGSLHSYADAHLVAVGGGAPQSHASSIFIDYIKPWESSPVGYTAYNLTLAIGGTHSLTDPFGPRPGYTAQGSVGYDIRDNRNGDVFAHGFFNSSDAVPGTTVIASIVVPADEATDYLKIEINLDTYAYVSNTDPAFETAFADYSHTLVAHLDAVTSGASTLGVSGFNYATPAVASVPEPSTGLLMGVAVAALALMRWRADRRGLDLD